MTEQSPAVTVAHPPKLMLRVVNPALRFMLRTPFAGAARQQFMVLTVRGRKTGRQYAIPLSAHFIDNTLYAMTDAGWKHNFRDGATAEVLHNGKTATMRASSSQTARRSPICSTAAPSHTASNAPSA